MCKKNIYINRLILILGLIILSTQSFAQDQKDTASDTLVYDEGLPPMPDYGYFGLGGFYDEDSIRITRFFNVIAGYNIFSDKISYEFHIYFSEMAKFKARRENDRLMATIFVQSAFVALSMWTGMIIGDVDFMGKKVVPVLLAPFGSHIAWRPHYNVAIFAGLVPDLMLCTDDDGVLFQFRTGIRYSIGRTGFVLEVEVVKNRFWAWESESRTYDWGVGVYLHFDPKFIQLLR